MLTGCNICSYEPLTPIEGFADLIQVTSDCKPFPAGSNLFVCAQCGGVQRRQDAKWFADCSEIYQRYTPNAQAEGLEPIIFSADGNSVRRPVRVVELLFKSASLPAAGKALDVGCGNGGILKVFSAQLPGWELAGQDIDDKYAEIIKKIPGVTQFLRCELEDLPESYDVISMVHVFEHIPNPREMLKTLRQKLREDGLLVISIPCFLDNPFDLAVADHSFHFSPSNLQYLLAGEGFEVLANETAWIPKEIVCIAKKSAAKPAPVEKTITFEAVQRRVDWLRQVLRDAQEWSKQSPVALFGSSISASWVYGGIAERVLHFVDEDARRFGKTWLERKIVHPRDSLGCPILMPLPPIQAGNVKKRLEETYPGIRIISLGGNPGA